jgi:hypothetical protein
VLELDALEPPFNVDPYSTWVRLLVRDVTRPSRGGRGVAGKVDPLLFA